MSDVFPRRNLGSAEYWGRTVETRIQGVEKTKAYGDLIQAGSNRGVVASASELSRNIELLQEQAAATQGLIDATPATGSNGAFVSNFSLSPGWQTVLVTAIPPIGNRKIIDVFAMAVCRIVDPGTGGGSTGGFRWPFPPSTVTSEYGPRDGRMHEGIDFGVPEGTPIPASNAGTVTGNGYGSGTGWYVDITHPQNIRTRYFHMVAQSDVAIGTVVSKSQVIGFVGNTGNSFGAHLHWETIVNGSHWNPRDFMAVYGDGGGGSSTPGAPSYAQPRARMYLNGMPSVEFSPHRDLAANSVTLNQLFPLHQLSDFPSQEGQADAELQLFSQTSVPANAGNFARLTMEGVFRA